MSNRAPKASENLASCTSKPDEESLKGDTQTLAIENHLELKALHEACVRKNLKLTDDLQSTRKTSIERKDELREALVKIATQDSIIKSLRDELESKQQQHDALKSDLSRMSAQIELIKDLCFREID